MRRAVVAGALAAVALLIVTAGPAAAVPILAPADAEELALELEEATEVQGICYGWRVRVSDADRILTGEDVGSSRGVGKPAPDVSCPRWMVFEATLTYTSESSESEDSATFRVFSNVTGAPDEGHLRRAGVNAGALLGADDDVAVINATLALPALAAELQLAPPLPLDRNADDIPEVDRPTGAPGSDWLRSYGDYLGLIGVLVVGGLAWAGWAWAAGRRERDGEDGEGGDGLDGDEDGAPIAGRGGTGRNGDDE